MKFYEKGFFFAMFRPMFLGRFRKKRGNKGWIMTMYNFHTSHGFPVLALFFFLFLGGGCVGAGKLINMPLCIVHIYTKLS